MSLRLEEETQTIDLIDKKFYILSGHLSEGHPSWLSVKTHRERHNVKITTPYTELISRDVLEWFEEELPDSKWILNKSALHEGKVELWFEDRTALLKFKLSWG